MEPYKDHKTPRQTKRRRAPRLRYVLALALAATAAFAGPVPTRTHTPVHPSAFDLLPYDEADWERQVSSLEAIAIAHPEDAERQVAAYAAHLAREGWRLGQLDGAAQALGGVRP